MLVKTQLWGLGMSASKAIRQLMVERDMTIKDMAEMLGIKAQSMSTKLYRDKFTYNEVEKIAEMLNADVRIITRDEKKMF